MIRPRVHWVSPLPPAETDIAHYTLRILPELAAAVDLTLWTDAPDWDPALEAHCPVRRFDPQTVLPRDLAGQGAGDVVFLNIGNSWVYHSGIFRLAQRLPAVIVLHDMAIQEMAYDSIRYDGFDPEVYRAGMARWYGTAGETLTQDLLDTKINAQDVAQSAPGFELTMDRAISVLTHTQIAYDAVVAREALPAYLLDLPFAPSDKAPSARRAPKGPLRLVQFGYIGPNRRLSEVLQVLAGLKGEVDFHLDVMGKIWDHGRIADEVATLDLGTHVTLHGFVEEPELDAALARAHLVFNLRYPTMGEASGSQLRIWNAEAAGVVSDLGFYATLPEDTVFRIPHADEAAALADLIRRINADRALGESIGKVGRTLLEARHTPARYAQAIAEVARRAERDAANAMLARSARRVLGRCAATNTLLHQRLAQQLSD